MTQYLWGLDNGIPNSKHIKENNPNLKSFGANMIVSYVGSHLLSVYAHAKFAKWNTEEARTAWYPNFPIVKFRNAIQNDYSNYTQFNIVI